MAQLLFFGRFAEMAGGRKRSWPINPETASVRALVRAIELEEPEFGAALSSATTRYVVNETMADFDSMIGDEDEIAFLPPVSGG